MLSDKEFLNFINDKTLYSSDIRYIKHLLNNELSKSEEEMDTAFIDQCIDILSATISDSYKNEVEKGKNRMKKRIIISIAAVFVVIITAVLSFAVANGRYPKMEKIEIDDFIKSKSTDTMLAPFNAENIITGHNYNVNTLTFKGKVLEINAYKSSWKDDSGDKWGPFNTSILSVEITETYNDSIYKAGDIINVSYSYVVNAERGTIKISENSEYIFIGSWIKDEKYYEYATSIDNTLSWANNPILDHTDLFAAGVRYSLCPVYNETIVVYNGYFTKEELEEISLDTSIIKDFITSPETADNGFFTVVKEKDFIEKYYSLSHEFAEKRNK